MCVPQGYIFKIKGGNDKQGFGMKQGVLTNTRVHLMMKPGDSCFRGYGRRNGEERRNAWPWFWPGPGPAQLCPAPAPAAVASVPILVLV